MNWQLLTSGIVHNKIDKQKDNTYKVIRDWDAHWLKGGSSAVKM